MQMTFDWASIRNPLRRSIQMELFRITEHRAKLGKFGI
jgi:hypothetical protein